MQLLHTERVNAFVARLKAEHLTQSDPNVQARVLVLASEYFDTPSIVEDSGQVPMSRRALGLVPDGVVSGVAHAPVLVGNATAPRFVEPPPTFMPKSLLTEQEELAGHPLSNDLLGQRTPQQSLNLAPPSNDFAVESEPVAADPTQDADFAENTSAISAPDANLESSAAVPQQTEPITPAPVEG